MKPIEVYVRPKGDGGSLHLNLYASSEAKRQLLQGLGEGSFSQGGQPVGYLEFTLMPDWFEGSEDEQRIEAPVHVRVPLTAVNLHVDDE